MISQLVLHFCLKTILLLTLQKNKTNKKTHSFKVSRSPMKTASTIRSFLRKPRDDGTAQWRVREKKKYSLIR